MRKWSPKMFGLIVVWIGLNHSMALACACVGMTPNDNLQEADVVFAGKVIAVDQADGWIRRIEFERRPPFIYLYEDVDRIHTRFEVSTVWKGEIFANTSVFYRGHCGASFSRGESYIVYAKRVEEKLYTYACWRDNKLIDAGEDLAAFGAGRPPAPNPPFYIRKVITMLMLLSLLGSAAWMARRKYGVQKS